MRLLNYDAKPTAILDHIRDGMSTAYQERIPSATQTTFATVGDAILNHSETRNDFLNALVDKVALEIVKNANAVNILEIFKRGMKQYGKDVIETYVGLIKAQSYDSEAGADVEFKTYNPNVLSVFHTTNRKDQYPLTIKDTDLKSAFTSEGEFTEFINKLINSIYESDSQDEYLMMKALLSQAMLTGKCSVIVIDPVTDKTSVEDAVVKIKETSTKMAFLNNIYNFAGVDKRTPKNNQVIFVPPMFDALADVKMYANMFNMPLAQFDEAQKIVLDDFGGVVNVEAVLTSADWMLAWDDELSMEEKRIASGKKTNYFYDHWQTLSSSPFEPFTIFVSVAPTLSEINVVPDAPTITKGGYGIQFNAYPVTFTGLPSMSVTWTHNGTDPQTSINALGYLVAGSGETQDPITVTATSDFNAVVSDTAIVDLV